MKKVVILFMGILFLTPTLSVQAQTRNSVDLLWQGEGSVAPFYKGRTLWGHQTRVTLIAIPQIAGINSTKNLNYKWTKNGTVLGNVSGLGKSSLSFVDPVLSEPQKITVDILSGSGATLATESITITPIDQSLLIYENNPLYGFMLHKEAEDSYNLINSEITFNMFPLFFSPESFKYSWATNAGKNGSARTATYRAPDSGSGTSQISVSVLNDDKILQSAQRVFLIKFGEQTAK